MVPTSAKPHCFTAAAPLAITTALVAPLLLHRDIPHSFTHCGLSIIFCPEDWNRQWWKNEGCPRQCSLFVSVFGGPGNSVVVELFLMVTLPFQVACLMYSPLRAQGHLREGCYLYGASVSCILLQIVNGIPCHFTSLGLLSLWILVSV